MHPVFLAVDRFFATQQFEEALQVARLVFDPTIDIEGTTSKGPEGSSSQSCWRSPPFLEMANDITQSGNSTVDLKKLTEEMELAILERRSHGGLVHATARGRPQAYMKWIVMKYAEILIAAGDVHFRKGTLESLPLATQRYVEAAHVLGPKPPKVP
ncbi:hypothetical protein H9Q69_005424 [Fusarium xylarioides]|uniref:Uncharacterized protein n=1 Tax=Fusarium xylarioides TaxID=221167 RepID=A0A9P7I9C5_9HYPO|nr:hypothetical protein H9Q72_002050 [Fusarium xylarioides]KAG5795534.1 hypothetical protein H9Q69_005424 [Fusarium xylarioides]